MEFKLNVELKVPEDLMPNLAEVDKTKLEEYLQECLVEYLSEPKQETKKLEFETSKQETKEFKFDDISEMPIDIEKLLNNTKALLNDVENEIIEEQTQPFKFDDIGAIANK